MIKFIFFFGVKVTLERKYKFNHIITFTAVKFIYKNYKNKEGMRFYEFKILP